MTKRIEEELAEMNRLKRLELEFLFFKSRMDATILEKFRNALTTENIMPEDIDLCDIDSYVESSKSKDGKIRNVPTIKVPIEKTEVQVSFW